MRLTIITLALLTTLSTPAFAADIQPGLWELTLETRVAATPDFSPPPNTMNQCLTEQDAQDPSRVFGGVANPGASDCTYTEKSYVGDTLNFKMKCAGTLSLEARGEITSSATSMQGSIVSTANLSGQAIEMQSKITAHRLGGC